MNGEGFFDKKTVLMWFDAIVDTDFGLMQFIKNKCGHLFNLDQMFFHNSDSRQRYLLLSRLDPNPLSVIDCGGVDRQAAYDNLMSGRLSEILELSTFNDMVNILITASSLNNIEICVFCRNEHEEQYIVKNAESLNINIRVVRSETVPDLTRYDAVYFNHIWDADACSQTIMETTPYLAMTRYNMTSDEGEYRVASEMLLKLSGGEVHLFTPYIMDDEYFTEG